MRKHKISYALELGTMGRLFRTPMLVLISIGVSATICLVEQLRFTGCLHDTWQLSSLNVISLLINLAIPFAVLALFQLMVIFTSFALSDQSRLPGLIDKSFGTLFVAFGGFILFKVSTDRAESLCSTAYWGGVSGADALAFFSILWFILWFGLTVVCVVANSFMPQGNRDV
jgi:hypothetical protein